MLKLPRPKLVLADQNDDTRGSDGVYLSANGFLVNFARNADELLGLVSSESYHLIIARLALPDIDELALLELLRNRTSTPCILISEKDDLVDRVLALELGADDYLGKLTDKREILARARAILRRAQLFDGAPAPPIVVGHRPGLLRFERLERRLRRDDGDLIALTTAEYNLLACFADHMNVPLTRDRLYELVYKRAWSAFDRTLDTLVAKLRRKVERDPRRPELIKTVHGTGYVFTGVNFACKL